MGSFKQELASALKYYKHWRKQKCYCPALKSRILITNRGWHHLVGNKTHMNRSLSDKYRRIKLLPYAKQVIETSHTIQDIKTINKRVYYTVQAVIPVNLNGLIQLRKVKVIIYEDAKGNKVFLSVMDKKM
jgi:hypothetical protein